MLSNRGKGVGLRLGAKKSGCTGFSYVVDYADEIEANNVVFESKGVTVVVDKEQLALLIQLTSCRTLEDINKLDVDIFFERLNLDENLSPNRHVGVYAIVELMKKEARGLVKQQSNVA